MNLLWDAYTHVGGRDNNEDNYYADGNDGLYLFVVADGLGGHDCGEVASLNAVEELKYQFESDADKFDLKQAICCANKRILLKQEATQKQMRTTIAAVFVNGNKTVIAHVGDSRCYAFLRGEIVCQTVDHSVSQMAVNVGEITADQIRHHADRNVLTRVLGADENVKVTVEEIETDKYDALLLASDGFWEYVLEEDMIRCKECATGTTDWLAQMRSLLADRVPPDHDNNTAITVLRSVD